MARVFFICETVGAIPFRCFLVECLFGWKTFLPFGQVEWVGICFLNFWAGCRSDASGDCDRMTLSWFGIFRDKLVFRPLMWWWQYSDRIAFRQSESNWLERVGASSDGFQPGSLLLIAFLARARMQVHGHWKTEDSIMWRSHLWVTSFGPNKFWCDCPGQGSAVGELMIMEHYRHGSVGLKSFLVVDVLKIVNIVWKITSSVFWKPLCLLPCCMLPVNCVFWLFPTFNRSSIDIWRFIVTCFALFQHLTFFVNVLQESVIFWSMAQKVFVTWDTTAVPRMKPNHVPRPCKSYVNVF